MGIKEIIKSKVNNKRQYIVTINKDNNTFSYTKFEDDEIILENKVRIVVGVTKPEDLPSYMTIEPLTSYNKFKVKKVKKLTK